MFADYKSRHFTKVVNGEINHWLDFEIVQWVILTDYRRLIRDFFSKIS